MATAFLTSTEYTQTHGDASSFIRGLYMDIFQRSPDNAGFSFWTQVLQNGARSRADIAYYFLTSLETYLQAIDGYYVEFLGRSATMPEEQGFLDFLISGATPGQQQPTEWTGHCEGLSRQNARSDQSQSEGDQEDIKPSFHRAFPVC